MYGTIVKSVQYHRYERSVQLLSLYGTPIMVVSNTSVGQIAAYCTMIISVCDNDDQRAPHALGLFRTLEGGAVCSHYKRPVAF